MANFNIRQDLEFRSLDQQVEILWISGPTWHNAEMIADRLQIGWPTVQKVLKQLKKEGRVQ